MGGLQECGLGSLRGPKERSHFFFEFDVHLTIRRRDWVVEILHSSTKRIYGVPNGWTPLTWSPLPTLHTYNQAQRMGCSKMKRWNGSPAPLHHGLPRHLSVHGHCDASLDLTRPRVRHN